jgi:uncharacterized membrane protein
MAIKSITILQLKVPLQHLVFFFIIQTSIISNNTNTANPNTSPIIREVLSLAFAFVSSVPSKKRLINT